MRFGSPFFLLLLLLLPLLAWMGWPSAGRWHRREFVSLVLRLVIAACLILALAGLQLVRGGNDLALVFLVDVSDSMPQQAVSGEIGYVREALAGMGPNDQAAVILFGADALVERPMLAGRELSTVTSVPITTQTDLAKAIQLGMALYPSGPARRMVILSDGAETGGNAQSAAQIAAASGVQIFSVPFVSQPGADAMVTGVDAPTHLRPGEKFDLNMNVQASAPMQANIRVIAGDQVVYDQPRELRRGTQTFSLPLTAGDPGFIDYRVQITPGQDLYYQNNTLDAFSRVEGPPGILMVASQGSESRPEVYSALMAALKAAGFRVDRVPPQLLPSDLPGLARYDSIVLVDVPATELGVNQMEALQSYVRDVGGGLVVVGGPASYGVGGYYDTPLESALPVDMQIKDEKRRPSLGIVFIIDHSGSMGETSGSAVKLELAKEAAARSVRMLFPTDRVGVIAFDDVASWVVPMTPLSDALAVTRAIGSIQVGGGTDILGGVHAMARVLPGDPAKVKHVILLTDGGADPTGIPELVQQLHEQGITLSTVGIGNDAAPFLKDLASIGGGRYHFTSDAGSIPSIFTEETTMAMRAYLVEEPFHPKLASPSPVLSGIGSVPELYGYVASSPKPLAQVILQSDQKDPILATWQYGLGRSVAFTSDATGHWARDWVNWKNFPAFWAQVVQSTMGGTQNAALNMSVKNDEASSTITLDALTRVGDFLNGYQVKANIVSPAGDAQTITLQQVAPGRYEGVFEPAQQGNYIMRFTGVDEGGASFSETQGWTMSYSPEYGDTPPNPDLLVRLATITGGKVAPPNPSASFEHTLLGSRATRPVAPWLIVLAALLLPLDVASRRLALSRTDLLRWRDRLVSRIAGPAQQGEAPALPDERMSALMRSKERVQRIDAWQGKKPAAGSSPQPLPPDTLTAERITAPREPGRIPPATPESQPALTQALLKRKNQLKKDK